MKAAFESHVFVYESAKNLLRTCKESKKKKKNIPQLKLVRSDLENSVLYSNGIKNHFYSYLLSYFRVIIFIWFRGQLYPLNLNFLNSAHEM